VLPAENVDDGCASHFAMSSPRSDLEDARCGIDSRWLVLMNFAQPGTTFARADCSVRTMAYLHLSISKTKMLEPAQSTAVTPCHLPVAHVVGPTFGEHRLPFLGTRRERLWRTSSQRLAFLPADTTEDV
jgi:hypothetical protein